VLVGGQTQDLVNAKPKTLYTGMPTVATPCWKPHATAQLACMQVATKAPSEQHAQAADAAPRLLCPVPQPGKHCIHTANPPTTGAPQSAP
jgi:hypothetical protein